MTKKRLINRFLNIIPFLSGIICLILLVFLVLTNISPKKNHKVILIGIDGMEWDIIKPLIEKNELPNIKKLMDKGTYGNLRSIEPMKTPLIWTSIATGKTGEEHGITDFLIDGQTLTSNHRKVPALWNILSKYNKSVGVMGYYASWPAEKVNGYIVSRRYYEYLLTDKAKVPDLTYPPELLNGFKEQNKADYDYDKIYQEIIRFTDKDILNYVDKDFKSDSKEETYQRLISFLRAEFSKEKLRIQITLSLLKNIDQPDLFIGYYDSVDAVSHKYWKYYQPEYKNMKFRNPPTEEEKEIFENIIPEFYKHTDESIGKMQEIIDPGTNIIIVSDHGFKHPLTIHHFEDGAPGHAQHKINGVFLAKGPLFKNLGEVNNLSVYDIAPLILHIQGIPKDPDMKNLPPLHLLKEIVEPVEKLKDLDDNKKGKSESEGSPYEEEMKERLRALGYIT